MRSGDGLVAADDLPDAARAAVGDALVPLDGAAPDLVAVFVVGDDPDDNAAALRAAHLTAVAAGARTTIGASAVGVVGAGRAVTDGPAVAAWAGVLPGARVRSFHLEVLRAREAWAVVGMPVPREDDVVGLLLADPWSFPAEGFVGAAGGPTGALSLVGGMAHGPNGAGSTRLMVDGVLHERGAVGTVLAGVDAGALVNPGHRPFGPPMTVTGVLGTVVAELAGAPASEQLAAAVAALDAEDRALARHGVMLGVAVDEYVDDHGTDELVVRSILDVDDERGCFETPDPIPVGTTVRFCLLDPDHASAQLSDGLLGLRRDHRAAPFEGALLVACADRYAQADDVLEGDVRSLRRVLGAQGVAGMLAGGEIGPSPKGNQLHGLSATVLALSGSDEIVLDRGVREASARG